VLNVIRNAQEALSSGGIISVTTALEAGRAKITISDNGPGIAEKDRPLIFEPFFTRKGAGTGLGLSITQRIVEEHGGRIRVQSELGAGTTFAIELPTGERGSMAAGSAATICGVPAEECAG
jgi:signal transduction histidine kinase